MQKITSSDLMNDRKNGLDAQSFFTKEDLSLMNFSENEVDFIFGLLEKITIQETFEDQFVFDLSNRQYTSMYSGEDFNHLLIQYPPSSVLSERISNCFESVKEVVVEPESRIIGIFFQ